MQNYYRVPRYCGIYYIPVHGASQPSWLPQVSLFTAAEIHDTASCTTLTQTFVNPSQTSAIAKAKYTFPLYESCAVVSFRCYIGSRLIEGVIKEKGQAKVEYQKAVDKGDTAGLLEQHTPDVFSTSLGNIPAGETVKIEIQYLIELKHDAEVDGLRFTVPTSIAPRYGDMPSDYTPGAIEKGGMKISVKLTMPSPIRSVQSPSHNITMHLGGHVEESPDDSDFDPKRAVATLTQTTTELGKDFVLLVKCADLSFPRALLETHPTIPNSKALMITLVPKFTLPPGPKPEIVFVVDRSGSMRYRMGALKSSLLVFLKSLPVGIKFNICSFGSHHSFLWKKSKSYSAESLDEANRHVQSMDADFGGTEFLPPITATVSQRYEDLPLEIMVLTDGEVWNTEPLFEYVERATTKGDVRLFSLGIGQDVSHALVEGLARVGRGFSQAVSDETERMEGKVVRMLRGGLSAHVKDYRLEWDGKPSEENAEKPKSATVTGATDKRSKKISLFDTNADTEPPISFSSLSEFVVPNVLQAPYKLPPLFPFSRSTAYAILSGDAPPPSSVWLRGTTPSGDELALEIHVETRKGEGDVVHKLAARKILQELEEGTGYLHSGKYGIDKKLNPGTFDDWVQREGVRVGVKYGLASKWTSFLAVREEAKNVSEQGSEMDVGPEADGEFEFIDDGTVHGEIVECRSKSAAPVRDKYKTASFTPSLSTSQPPPPRRSLGGFHPAHVVAQSASTAPTTGERFRMTGGSMLSKMESRYRSQPETRSRDRMEVDEQLSSNISLPSPGGIALDSSAPQNQTMALIALQTFEGSFPLTPALAAVLGTTLTDLETKLKGFVPSLTNLSEEQKRRLWATVLAVTMFERKLTAERDVWELVVDKARAWVVGLVGAGCKDITDAEGLVGDVFG